MKAHDYFFSRGSSDQGIESMSFISPALVEGLFTASTTWKPFFFLITPHNFLEKEMATHSSTLAWKIPWMEEPGALLSMGLQRVKHD